MADTQKHLKFNHHSTSSTYECGRSVPEMLAVVALILLLTFLGFHLFGVLRARVVAKDISSAIATHALIRQHDLMKKGTPDTDILHIAGPHHLSITIQNGEPDTLFADTFWITLDTTNAPIDKRVCQRLSEIKDKLKIAPLHMLTMLVNDQELEICPEEIRKISYLFSKNKPNCPPGSDCNSACDLLKCICEHRLCPFHSVSCTDDGIVCKAGYKNAGSGCDETCVPCEGRENCAEPTTDFTLPSECAEGYKPNATHTGCTLCALGDDPTLCGCSDGQTPNGHGGCGCEAKTDCMGYATCDTDTSVCLCERRECNINKHWNNTTCQCEPNNCDNESCPCTTDDDCVYGEKCLGPENQKTCKTPTCEASGDCAFGFVCGSETHKCETLSCDRNEQCTDMGTCAGCFVAEGETIGTCQNMCTEVAYLISSGTQWINTGYYPNQNTSVELKFNGLSNAGQQDYFGAHRNGSNSSQQYVYGFYDGGSNVYDNYGDDLSFKIGHISGEMLLKKNKHKTSLTGAYNISKTHSQTTFSAGYPLYLFARNKNTANAYRPAKMYCYYFKIWDNSTLVRDFIPVLAPKTSGLGVEPAMLDKVNNKLYYNAGSGTFGYAPKE